MRRRKSWTSRSARPLETALNSVEGLESTSSTSRNGVSQISLAFTYGIQPGPGPEPDRPRHLQRQAGRCRRTSSRRPSPGSISDFPIVFLAVSSDKPLSELNADLAPAQRPAAAEARRRPRRRRDRRRHPAHPDPAAARRTWRPAGASIQSISDALKNNGAPGPGRHHRGTGQDPLAADRQPGGLPRRHQGAPAGRAPAMRRRSAAWRTSASVEDARTSITRTNGKETLALSVTKKPEGDTVAISHAVKDALPAAGGRARLQRQVHPGLRPGAVHREVHQGPHHRGPARPGLRRRWSSWCSCMSVRVHPGHGGVHPAVAADHVHRALGHRLLAEHPHPRRAHHRDRPGGGRLDRGDREHQAAPELRRGQDHARS